MKHTYKVEKDAFSLLDNYFYSFDETNKDGEIIQCEITKITNDGRKAYDKIIWENTKTYLQND